MDEPPENLEVEPGNPRDVLELLEKIGEGGSGCFVHRARVRLTSEIVCVKVVPLTGIDDEIAAATREINALQGGAHPNIVGYRGTFWDQGALWMVMEFCAGGTVDDIVGAPNGHTLSERCIAYVCHEALLALRFLHDMKIIHRDVKGSNILLTEQGGVKLSDFGVSAQLMNTLSRRNSTVGTLFWMAPEAIQNLEYDGRADIWSLGITVIEMAEGRPPLMELSRMRVLFEIPRRPPPKMTNKAAWSPKLHNFVARCLTKNFEERPTAAQLLQDPFILEAQNRASELVSAIRERRLRLQAAGSGGGAGGAEEEEEVSDDSGDSIRAHRTGGSGGTDEGDSDDETLVVRADVAASGAPGVVVGDASRAAARAAAPPPSETVASVPLWNLDEVSVEELCEARKAATVGQDGVDGMAAGDSTHALRMLRGCMAHQQRLIGDLRLAPHEVKRRAEAIARYRQMLAVIEGFYAP